MMKTSLRFGRVNVSWYFDKRDSPEPFDVVVGIPDDMERDELLECVKELCHHVASCEAWEEFDAYWRVK